MSLPLQTHLLLGDYHVQCAEVLAQAVAHKDAASINQSPKFQIHMLMCRGTHADIHGMGNAIRANERKSILTLRVVSVKGLVSLSRSPGLMPENRVKWSNTGSVAMM